MAKKISLQVEDLADGATAKFREIVIPDREGGTAKKFTVLATDSDKAGPDDNNDDDNDDDDDAKNRCHDKNPDGSGSGGGGGGGGDVYDNEVPRPPPDDNGGGGSGNTGNDQDHTTGDFSGKTGKCF